ncbi:hypothetical protein RHECNPAF_2190060 [Rhizobium etli CNPAF512]|nr:hypothetical protein RHECNPAF_2190060 [Rhizobium etli CNPAF512]
MLAPAGALGSIATLNSSMLLPAAVAGITKLYLFGSTSCRGA